MDSLHKAATYDIGGIRYPQPFKIRRLGHFGFNVADLQGGHEGIAAHVVAAGKGLDPVGGHDGPPML